MKAELVVEGRSARQIELVSSPHIGDTIFASGDKMIVKSVVHDISKRKLQVICGNSNPFEAFCHSPQQEIDTDLDDADQQ